MILINLLEANIQNLAEGSAAKSAPRRIRSIVVIIINNLQALLQSGSNFKNITDEAAADNFTVRLF